MRLITIPAVISLSFALIACDSMPQKSEQAEKGQTSIDAKIEYQSKPRYLKISRIMQKNDPALTVFVEFANTDSDDRQGYYRASWLDASGMPVWEQEAWKTLLLHGNQKEMVKLVAPTSKAQDFRIQFNAVDNWRD